MKVKVLNLDEAPQTMMINLSAQDFAALEDIMNRVKGHIIPRHNDLENQSKVDVTIIFKYGVESYDLNGYWSPAHQQWFWCLKREIPRSGFSEVVFQGPRNQVLEKIENNLMIAKISNSFQDRESYGTW